MKPCSTRMETSFTTVDGRYIVRGGAVASQGGASSQRMVIIELASMGRDLA